MPELWTFRSQDRSLPGAKVPGVELSLPRTFAPWNFRSHQRIQQGAYSPAHDVSHTVTPKNIRSVTLATGCILSLNPPFAWKVPGSESSTPGTFAPGSKWSWEQKVQFPSAFHFRYSGTSLIAVYFTNISYAI